MQELFTTPNSGAEIFISLGVGCPTGCQSCGITNMQLSYFSLKEIKESLDKGHKITDKNFSFFLYGTDNTKNPHLKEILEYINTLGRDYKIQIPIEAQKKDIEQIVKFAPKRDIYKYIISKKIQDSHDIKIFIKSLEEITGIKNTFLNYDLLVDLKYKELFEKIFTKSFIKESEGIYFLEWKNIKLYIRSLYFINHQQKSIENLNLKSCLVYESFHIHKDYIEVLDHFEIDKNLDITFHNPLCYIGKPIITNLSQKPEKILHDFSVYKDTYLKKLNTNLEKNCFTCISNSYDYKKTS